MGSLASQCTLRDGSGSTLDLLWADQTRAFSSSSSSFLVFNSTLSSEKSARALVSCSRNCLVVVLSRSICS